MTIMRYLKIFLIFFHLLIGVFLSLFIFFSIKKIQKKIIQFWCHTLLLILDVQLSINQNLSLLLKKNHCLVVCNHISWLDIIILNSLHPLCFVAKDNIKHWPIINILAKACDTIFINRDSISGIRNISSIVEEMLLSRSICIFPEGTSTNGLTVLKFKSNLFQAAINSKKNILPIAIQYQKNYKSLPEVGYYGNVSLISSIWNVVRLNKITANLTVLPIIKSVNDRKLLAFSSFVQINKIILK